MSRIGNRELTIPAGVTVTVNENVVTVKGAKGELSLTLKDGIKVNVEECFRCIKIHVQTQQVGL